ncbi:hypothetical protein [Salinimicrobium xinjiangense]|uniref:hypothetical protein n=1 Tax=Salinimicrobium xinjiangense TaxID=438596 RepID=UPI000405A7F8|nr:hypothetical protein [Salinimicrobium xinjiangense]
MKKVIFGILFLFTLFLAVQIFDILVSDFDRLTEYGYGYLAGKAVLFILLLSANILVGITIHRDSVSKN